MATEREQIRPRLDPDVHDSQARWAGDELRSTNAQTEFLLRRALADASRLPSRVRPQGRPGRPQNGTDMTSHAKFPGKTLANDLARD